jgi:hypothetical protein
MLNFLKRLTHDYLHWGYPNGMKEFDYMRFQDTYHCRYCEKSVTQDSTGAWFYLN